MTPQLLERLRMARNVLGGVDGDGVPTHPSMFDEKVISLAHGDGTRRPHDSVVAAGVAALLETRTASLDDYMFLRPHEEFEAAIAVDFTANGIPAEVSRNVAVASGTTRLFAAFLHACARPGDVFGVPRSYYHPLPAWCALGQVELELVPTTGTTDYKLTPALLDAWVTRNRRSGGRPRGLFLFNPTQTGALYETDELAALAGCVRKHDLYVLEDCVFAGTEFPGQRPVQHLTAAAPELSDRVVVLKGASKAHNLANIRIGWGCGPDTVVRMMNDYTVATATTVPYVAKEMALAALQAPTEYLRENAAECAGRAALITELVAECNDAVGAGEILRVIHQPQAGHGILVGAPGLRGRRMPDGTEITGSVDVARYLLSAAQVATSPGFSLGFDGTELRMVFGSVGVRQTYPPDSVRELATTLRRLAVPRRSARSDSTGRVLAVGDAVVAGDTRPGPDLFRPGRDLIATAFRDRITPAIRRLVRRSGVGAPPDTAGVSARQTRGG
ncbi:MAG TPA: aminotransferase class I/II-fold pyridoxal phosphate-dependent enzyme [Mycobacteriales bacterium]|nr:aminotransferase class I/II-fold pyridoxal phosphate-dependent enzyme [Mycobacteriales bacterium]